MSYRRDEIARIIKKCAPRNVNIAQVVAHVECVDALSATHPNWVKALGVAGSIELTPATTAALFSDAIAEKKSLERIRDGITAMKIMFARMSPEARRSVAIEAFRATEQANATADVALQELFETVLWGVKATIAALAKSAPPSVTTLQLPEKKSLERVRDSITAMKIMFARMSLDARRSVAIEAFQAAGQTNATVDVALQELFETVLSGVKATIAALSQSTPPSDRKLQMRAQVAFLAAVFHRYELQIGTGDGSPYVSVCNVMGISRSTVRRYFANIQPHLDQYVRDLWPS